MRRRSVQANRGACRRAQPLRGGGLGRLDGQQPLADAFVAVSFGVAAQVILVNRLGRGGLLGLLIGYAQELACFGRQPVLGLLNRPFQLRDGGLVLVLSSDRRAPAL